MFVFVYSSYHLKLSFPHLVVILTTLETPKNIFCFNNNIVQNDNAAGIRASTATNLQVVLNTQKHPYLNQATQKNTCQIFLPKKLPESKISNPKKSFDHPRHLKSGVPPPPPPWGFYQGLASLADAFLARHAILPTQL